MLKKSRHLENLPLVHPVSNDLGKSALRAGVAFAKLMWVPYQYYFHTRKDLEVLHTRWTIFSDVCMYICMYGCAKKELTRPCALFARLDAWNCEWAKYTQLSENTLSSSGKISSHWGNPMRLRLGKQMGKPQCYSDHKTNMIYIHVYARFHLFHPF